MLLPHLATVAVLLAVALTRCGRLAGSGGAVRTMTGIGIGSSAADVSTPAGPFGLPLRCSAVGIIPHDVAGVVDAVTPGSIASTSASIADDMISVPSDVATSAPPA